MANFTAAQREAVTCDAKEILVSAAAGSGKTAVLTERIIRHISDGIGLSELLVVTFTEAASAEMRERIENRLTEDEKLSHHAYMLPTADISTIHAFCKKLIKENFQEIDIDPAFRVGDEAELGLVKSLVMNELFESAYLRAENADFLDLIDVYGGKTTDGRLETLIYGIYHFIESDPFPKEALKRYSAFFEHLHSIDETPWAEIAREELALELQGAVDGLRQAAKICEMPGGPYKYVEKLSEEREMLRGLLEEADALSFRELYQAFKKIEWGRLPTVSKKEEVNDGLKERVQRIRNKAVKERIKKITQGIFFAPPDKMLDDLKALAPRVSALMRLTENFSDAYAQEKRERNIMDFSDLEHFAIRILYPNGPGDMTAVPPGQKYDEVLIDEYQDSNEVQDLILSAVAERRFIVGDVKQSIYRFRRANPALFLQKYNDFAQNPSLGTRIDLSHNFRSNPEVINAVNFFFSQLMCREVGGVDYDENVRLYPGHAEYPKGAKTQVEILEEETDEEETVSNVIAETRVIAECINELLEKRKDLRQCDIAVLSRSFSAIAGEVINELKNYGIDAVADVKEGFFDRSEIKTALAFLRVIDNPRQDIDLIAVLTSPVYAFDADGLFEISRGLPETNADFYDKLCAFAPENEKARKFLSDLEELRAKAVYLPISRLIGFIYDFTQYPSHVANMAGGLTRQANLRLLLERAIEFEETGNKRLFQFIRYLERLAETGNTAAAPAPTVGETDFCDKVRLMTIHKSKGLEFPVVICAFLSKKFNTDDERRPVILHPAKGVGPFYINTDLRTRSNTLARFGLSRLNRRENLSEELRCLYVALTRAKEKLILTGRVKNFEASKEKWADHIGGKQLSAANYLDWLMPCLLRKPEEADGLFNIRVHGAKPEKHALPQKIDAPPVYAAPVPPAVKIQNRPSKLSISEIKRLYDITPDSSFRESPAPSFNPPAFLKAESGVTPMRMGSVLHTITEHMDYGQHTNHAAIETLLDELTEKNFISREEAAAVEREKILMLANSPLAGRLRKAAAQNKLFREVPFVLSLPVTQLYEEAENTADTILVHGIIDCYFEEDGKLILLDYKNDNINKSVSLNEWAETHRVQLEIYKQALEKSTGMEVSETLLYSFYRGETVFIYRVPQLDVVAIAENPRH